MIIENETKSSINKLLDETMENIKLLSSSSTIFGEPVILNDGTSIIPVSKISMGFVVGGGEYADLGMKKTNPYYPMAGGSGGGISSSPIGFIVNNASEIKFISTANAALMEAFMEKISNICCKIKEKINKEDKNEDKQ